MFRQSGNRFSESGQATTIESGAMLSCVDLAKTYATERGEIDAVKGIDIAVQPGEFTSIVGRSGSGKSSFLAMIGGLSRPSRGKVRIEDTDVWSLSDDHLAKFRNRRIGFVYQFASLLPTLRIVDNVALPALLDRNQDAESAYGKAVVSLEQLGLSDYIDAYPAEISAGEQRRAVIARALINSPALLLADEPTSDLDEETERQIMDQFRKLNRERGVTLMMVTHNLRLAEETDRIIHIAGGRLAS